MKHILIIVIFGLTFLPPAHARELKLAVWNLSWLTQRSVEDGSLPPGVLSKTEEDITRLRGYATAIKADVIAFEGVDGPEIAAKLFPPDQYRIHITDDPVLQRSGFAIARELSFTVHPDLTALDIYPNARFRLRSAADITLDLPGTKLRLLALHLKAGCVRDKLEDEANPACRTINRQIAPLQAWITERQQSGEAFILLGDFNRQLDPHDPFLARLQEAAPLQRADTGLSSTCWGGGAFLEHILVGGAAQPMLVAGSFREMRYRETDPAMKAHLSSHCPSSVRLVVPDEAGVASGVSVH